MEPGVRVSPALAHSTVCGLNTRASFPVGPVILLDSSVGVTDFQGGVCSSSLIQGNACELMNPGSSKMKMGEE